MRSPIQCEGIERGPQRAAQIGVAGSVNPQFWGALASTLGPIALNALKGAIGGAMG